MTQRRLAHEVWGETHDVEALQLLRTTIGALRQKLEANPVRPRHIATEPGVGFAYGPSPSESSGWLLNQGTSERIESVLCNRNMSHLLSPGV